MNSEDFIMPFGKHKGKTLGQIVADNPAYLDWLSDLDLQSDLRAAVDDICDRYAAEIERAIGDDD